MEYGALKANQAFLAAELEASCLDTAWSEKQISDAASRSDTLYLAASEDGALLGVVSCVFSLYEGMVENVAVRAEARRRHIGEALMRAVEAEAKRRGVERLCLEVASRNLAATGLYLKCGYEKKGLRKGFYRKQKDDAVIMVKEIEK